MVTFASLADVGARVRSLATDGMTTARERWRHDERGCEDLKDSVVNIYYIFMTESSVEQPTN